MDSSRFPAYELTSQVKTSFSQPLTDTRVQYGAFPSNPICISELSLIIRIFKRKDAYPSSMEQCIQTKKAPTPLIIMDRSSKVKSLFSTWPMQGSFHYTLMGVFLSALMNEMKI